MLCQLSIGKRITKLHGMTYKITVPVNSCQQRYFSRFYSFRKSIHKLIGTISVPIICHLKIKLMVVIHLIGCIQTRLIAWYRVIEIGVMTHFNGIHPTLIPTELDRLFSGCQLPFIIQLPTHHGQFNRPGKIIQWNIGSRVLIQRLTEMIGKLFMKSP